ncbi:MAG: YabP/YqfC family sporulation protein [Clostridia bacterium]|nr:YabP/YqfC family sporulation protein [Clostridia bacterium]
MRLYDEIFKNTEGMALSRYTVAVGGGGYFEGVKAVGDFSSERIVLFFPRASVEVEGVDLSIAKYCDGDLRLSGKIVGVRLADTEARGKGD